MTFDWLKLLAVLLVRGQSGYRFEKPLFLDTSPRKDISSITGKFSCLVAKEKQHHVELRDMNRRTWGYRRAYRYLHCTRNEGDRTGQDRWGQHIGVKICQIAPSPPPELAFVARQLMRRFCISMKKIKSFTSTVCIYMHLRQPCILLLL